MDYLYDDPEWPAFRWDHAAIAGKLGDVRHRQGRLIGRMESLGLPLQSQATHRSLIDDAVKTSEIEGEFLDVEIVRSSVARRLGLPYAATPLDSQVEGVVVMLIDATGNFAAPLTEQRLFAWHRGLLEGNPRIIAGAWRDEPMRVVSGPIGREKVHYEAPPAAAVPAEMRAFLDWFNRPATTDPVLKAAVAHLWFITIHPFDDGNGRIARALTDMLLARSEGSSRRFYSMSGQIRRDRADYYAVLERTQKRTLDVTPWLEWFLGCLNRAIDATVRTLEVVNVAAAFWRRHEGTGLNDRQRRIIGRLLEGTFEGKLTSSKWAKLAKCSQDTALRDIESLIEHGIIEKEPGGGRSTAYRLLMP